MGLQNDGTLRYANNSHYRNDVLIRKEMFVSASVIGALQQIILKSDILIDVDDDWPEPDKTGRQELEIIFGTKHVSFCTAKINPSIENIVSHKLSGLQKFCFLTQEIKTF